MLSLCGTHVDVWASLMNHTARQNTVGSWECPAAVDHTAPFHKRIRSLRAEVEQRAMIDVDYVRSRRI